VSSPMNMAIVVLGIIAAWPVLKAIVVVAFAR
jgi:hypothetical protein